MWPLRAGNALGAYFSAFSGTTLRAWNASGSLGAYFSAFPFGSLRAWKESLLLRILLQDISRAALGTSNFLCFQRFRLIIGSRIAFF